MNRKLLLGVGALGLASAAPAWRAEYEPLDPRHLGQCRRRAGGPALFTSSRNLRLPTGADRLPFTLYRPAKKPRSLRWWSSSTGSAIGGRRPGDGLGASTRSWGALFAANGIAAVTMSAKPETLDRNLSDLVDHLAAHAATLGIDPSRGWPCSRHRRTRRSPGAISPERARPCAGRCGGLLLRQRAAGGAAQGQRPVLFVVAEGDMRSPFGGGPTRGSGSRIMESRAPWTLVFGARPSRMPSMRLTRHPNRGVWSPRRWISCGAA